MRIRVKRSESWSERVGEFYRGPSLCSYLLGGYHPVKRLS
jgi:hypothetical protein